MDLSPSPHHRHQSSLEGVISFSSQQPLSETERARAKQKFYYLINHFEQHANAKTAGPQSYNRPASVRLLYEQACSELSRDIVLRVIFESISLSLDDENDVNLESNEEELGSALARFADHIFQYLILPCR